jgi:hypothetical protein
MVKSQAVISLMWDFPETPPQFFNDGTTVFSEPTDGMRIIAYERSLPI